MPASTGGTPVSPGTVRFFMRIIDLSQPLYDGSPNCPEHPTPRVTLGATHEQVGWQLEMISMASHTGSHVDAPLHKFAGGRSLDDIPLERWVGEAVILDVRDSVGPSTGIGPELLKSRVRHPLADRIVLLNTGWGDRRAVTEEWQLRSPYLAPDGARWLVEQRIRGVGIDHYSIGGSGPDNLVTHEILLGAGVWIVEELRFPAEAMAAPQPCRFWCLPINLKGASGAFCRPVLVTD